MACIITVQRFHLTARAVIKKHLTYFYDLREPRKTGETWIDYWVDLYAIKIKEDGTMSKKLRDTIPEEMCAKCEKRVDCLREIGSVPTLVKAGPDEVCVLARPLTVMVPSSNFPWDIEVPGTVEIGSPATTERAQKLTQEELDAFRAGDAARLFEMVFASQDIKLPKTIKELRQAGSGVLHVVGMIVMILEAYASGNFRVYLKFPETHLHHKAQIGLVEMLRYLMKEPDGKE